MSAEFSDEWYQANLGMSKREYEYWCMVDDSELDY